MFDDDGHMDMENDMANSPYFGTEFDTVWNVAVQFGPIKYPS